MYRYHITSSENNQKESKTTRKEISENFADYPTLRTERCVIGIDAQCDLALITPIQMKSILKTLELLPGSLWLSLISEARTLIVKSRLV
jgi:hypothetical protein